MFAIRCFAREWTPPETPRASWLSSDMRGGFGTTNGSDRWAGGLDEASKMLVSLNVGPAAGVQSRFRELYSYEMVPA